MDSQVATRLWLTSPHFYPTYGGAQNRYRSYIPGFLARGLDVQVMTGTPQIEERSERDRDASWYQAKPGTWLPTTTLDGAPLERIRLPDSKRGGRTRIYYDALLEVCRRPASGAVVAQLLTNMRPQAQPWLRQLKQAGIATLYSVSQYPTWPQKPVKRLFRRRGYQQVYNEFDALVTNSPALERFLRDIGVTTRIEYIANGVNLQRFHPVSSDEEAARREQIRAGFNIPDHATVIAVVGAIMPRKAPDLVLMAWQQMLPRFPHTHLLFVGPRADTHDPKLDRFGQTIAGLVQRSTAPRQVHFAGIVDNVEDYLRAADAFVLASKREGTPNSLLEAMAVGLPAVTTPFIGISDSIGGAGEQFLLTERSPEAMAETLVAMFSQPELLQALRDRGRRYVTQNLDQQRSLDKYVELYRELGTLAARRGA
jgi:glycosyltransferase involved in cell wall biosynthesis